MAELGTFPSFRQWLRQYRHDQTPTGDLARDVLSDECWPRARGTRDLYEQHLIAHHACYDAINTLYMAWARYGKSRKAQQAQG